MTKQYFIRSNSHFYLSRSPLQQFFIPAKIYCPHSLLVTLTRLMADLREASVSSCPQPRGKRIHVCLTFPLDTYNPSSYHISPCFSLILHFSWLHSSQSGSGPHFSSPRCFALADPGVSSYYLDDSFTSRGTQSVWLCKKSLKPPRMLHHPFTMKTRWWCPESKQLCRQSSTQTNQFWLQHQKN